VVSALDSESGGPGSSLGRGHCAVVFLDNTLLSQCLSPPQKGDGKRNAGNNPAMD